MKKMVLRIDGMTCSACSNGLEKYLKRQKGIVDVEVNLVLALATITYEDLTISQIERYIQEAGFESLGEFREVSDEVKTKRERTSFIVFGLFLIFVFYVAMAHMFSLPEIPGLGYHDNPILYTSVLFAFSILFMLFGYRMLRSGILNLLHRMPNMDTLVMISVISSFFYSLYGAIHIFAGELEYLHYLYFEAICMVIYFVKLGRYIEEVSKDKTKGAIQELVQITPKKARVIHGEKEQLVDIDEVKIGDTLLCKPNEKIAVDGIVVKGTSHVDESFITGESVPVRKEKDANVIAGSMNYDGILYYKAERIGKKSTISEIVSLVIEATNYKNKLQRLADKISSYFVPVLMVIAVSTFVVYLLLGLSFFDSINAFVTILVVACPCSVGLAVPLVSVLSHGLCAKNGIFLKNAIALEQVRKIDTVVLDKTGTLTYGKLKVHKIYNYSHQSDQQLLERMASLEANSVHPIASAFPMEHKNNVTHFKNLDGMGLQGEIAKKTYYAGNQKLLQKLQIENIYTEDIHALTEEGCSIVFLIEEDKVLALFGVKDILRTDARSFVANLKSRNLDVIMLTGDHENTARLIANELGIDHVLAEVLPTDKLSIVTKLLDDGHQVMMIGDGINDAPSLVKATIGVSISDGTDVAADAADVLLVHNQLHHLLSFFDIGKKSYRLICQNLFWAFFYNVCMIPIAMGILRPVGITMNPMYASIAMIGSSLTVVFNSLRMMRLEKGEK